MITDFQEEAAEELLAASDNLRDIVDQYIRGSASNWDVAEAMATVVGDYRTFSRVVFNEQ